MDRVRLDDVRRAGTVRESMLANPLIADRMAGDAATLGRPKRVLCNRPPASLSFGASLVRGKRETVRDLILGWGGGPAAAQADAAADAARTAGKKERRQPRGTGRPLPSECNASHAYGLPSSRKPVEALRRDGPDSSLQDLVQNRFAHAWVDGHAADPAARMAAARASRATAMGPPAIVGTRAAEGHARGAGARLDVLARTGTGTGGPGVTVEGGKMSKFAGVSTRVGRTGDGPEAVPPARFPDGTGYRSHYSPEKTRPRRPEGGTVLAEADAAPAESAPGPEAEGAPAESAPVLAAEAEAAAESAD